MHPGWQDVPDGKRWQDVPDGKMFRMARKDKMFRMASPERAIYRAGSLTLSLDSVSACHVSNPERVIQHKALWPEVLSPAKEATVQPIVSNHPFVKQIKHWSGIYQKSIFALYRKGMWRGVTLHGNNPFFKFAEEKRKHPNILSFL